jgi:single-strand DNA-binding protein
MNNVILIGRLTANAVLKHTQQNKAVTSFTLAVSNGKDRPADFINCVAWEKTAELIAQYTQKGHMLGVQGKVSTRSYDDKDGRKQYVTEILVREIEFLEKAEKKGEQQVKSHYDIIENEETPKLTIESDDLPF